MSTEERFVPGYGDARERIFQLKGKRRYAEALAVIEALQRQGARTANLAVDHADVLARLGRPAEALEALEEARLEFPLSPYGRALLGGLLENAGRGDEARLVFDELSREPLLHRGALSRVVRHLRDRGEEERAVALARRSAEAAPSPAGARTLADTLEKAGHHREAVEVLRQAVKSWPGDEGLFEYFALLRLKGEDPETAVEELETLLAMPSRSGSVRLRSRLGVAHRGAGNLQAAREVLEDCAERAPGDRFVLGHLAHTWRDLGEPARAADLLERVLEADLQDFVARRTFFAACREAGQQERARAFVTARTAGNPSMRWLWKEYNQAFPRKRSRGGGDRPGR